MFTDFELKIKNKRLSNLRSLSVFTAVVVTVVGFVFEIAFHDVNILLTGLGVSLLFTANYYFSFKSLFYKKHFTSISYASIFILHFWEVYVAYINRFETYFLLPIALSIFIFSLVFGKFYKSFVFIFTITTFMLVLMIITSYWQTNYIIAIATLYSGGILAYIILQRKNEYHLEIYQRDKKYISLVENMNNGLIYVGNDDCLVFANEKFCRMAGYDNSQIPGKNIAGLFPNDSNEHPAGKFFSDLKAGLSVHRECRIKKNERRPYLGAYVRIPLLK